MKFAHILSRITGTHWLIVEDALENITALIESRMVDGARLVDFETAKEKVMKQHHGLLSRLDDGAAVSAAAPLSADGVAVIPIHGVIGKRLSAMEMMCGGADVDAIEAAFDAANSDPAVSKIVLHIDSPGGTVTGVPELARKIYNEKTKPVEAVTDTLIGSAAYYIASAADSIIATPTAVVGSIGVVLAVKESTSASSADGRTRLRVFRSGADKMAGIDGPLSEVQAKAYQESVDVLGAMFRSDVTKARPSIKAESMTGLTYFGDAAKARGLVDRVVPSLSRMS